jgi:FkbM family methyltransferase
MPTCKQRLEHAGRLGFAPRFVVDAGAYIGSWTEMVASIFPDADFLLIEPNPCVTEKLTEKVSFLGDRAHVVAKAIADEPGVLSLNIWGDPETATSASLQTHVKGPAETVVQVEVEALDNLLQQYHMRPDLVKLDLQGAEYQALLGAVETLQYAKMFIVEFGCLEAYVGRTTPRQLLDLFYDNGYSLYDLVDCHYRPYDGALTGGDFIFVRNDSLLRNYKGWD